MSFIPLSNRVLIKMSEASKQTASGLYIPPTAEEKPQQGVVISVGPGRVLDTGRLVECTVKKGDTVLLPKYSGTEIKLDGVEHMIVNEDEILGIIGA